MLFYDLVIFLLNRLYFYKKNSKKYVFLKMFILSRLYLIISYDLIIKSFWEATQSLEYEDNFSSSNKFKLISFIPGNIVIHIDNNTH